MYEGESAQFNCSLSESVDVPLWSINDIFYDWRDIPPEYTLSQRDFSLKIQNVTIEMNNTSFQCVVNRLYSEIGILTVLPLYPRTNSMFATTEFQGKIHNNYYMKYVINFRIPAIY